MPAPRAYLPVTEPQSWPDITVRAGILRPLEPPPIPDVLPDLPSSPREQVFASGYALSTHIIPAAYPRTYPHLPAPTLPDESLPKGERKAALKAIASQIMGDRVRYESGELRGEGSRQPLWCCLNRYIRNEPRRGTGKSVTLVFTHGNGFVKETWEPTLHALLSRGEKDSSGPVIDEIWCLDAVPHGDSALLNSENLSGLFDWTDYARDILHFLTHYLPDAASDLKLPVHLPRIPDRVAQARQLQGYAQRILVGVGHSFGGTAFTFAALTHPALFSSLVLIDPPIAPVEGAPAQLVVVVNATVGRRQHWPSRAAALSYFQSLPYLASWAPSVLSAYATHALTADSARGAGAVRLKGPVTQEAVVYERLGPLEAWARLPTLDARITLRWLMPTAESVFGNARAASAALVWRRAENASNCILDAGHLIPLEIPEQTAEEVFQFLKQQYGREASAGTARL